MRIGYACIPLKIDAKTTRSVILRNFSKEKLYDLIERNLLDLKRILQYNLERKIFLFRISSNIIPFGSHPVNKFPWEKDFAPLLKEIGDFIQLHHMRVSMHPGQYTVLNSPSADVVESAVRDLEYHARFLDSLGVDFSHKMVLHVGGSYGDKPAAMENFKRNFSLLSTSAKKRLIVENDERIYTIEEVLDLCEALHIPAVFDILHHHFNPSMTSELSSILAKVNTTWKEEDGPMKLHYSDADLQKRAGAHSAFVHSENFVAFYGLAKAFHTDIMLEVKDKDISAMKCIHIIQQLNGTLKKTTVEKEWAKYKYLVMEKNYQYYKEVKELLKNNTSILSFYTFIEKVLSLPYEVASFTNAAEHVWGYMKNHATPKEKETFFQLLAKKDSPEKVKTLLHRLAKKYNQPYLLESYYFDY